MGRYCDAPVISSRPRFNENHVWLERSTQARVGKPALTRASGALRDGRSEEFAGTCARRWRARIGQERRGRLDEAGARQSGNAGHVRTVALTPCRMTAVMRVPRTRVRRVRALQPASLREQGGSAGLGLRLSPSMLGTGLTLGSRGVSRDGHRLGQGPMHADSELERQQRTRHQAGGATTHMRSVALQLRRDCARGPGFDAASPCG
jgi:hypothetical protein